MRSANTFLVGTLGAALSLTGLSALTATPAQAEPGGTGLVISEVYGGGGNNGAVYNADFIELANPTDKAISLAGLAVHYRSASGGSGGVPTALSGTVPAKGHYLLKGGSGGTNGKALPDADATVPYNMAVGGGQVVLQSGTSIIATSGSTVGRAGIVDFVGASGATSFETAATTSAATAAKSLNRTGTTDTDSNAADFSLADPTPTSSKDAVAALAATDPGDVAVVRDGAIAPITLAATGGTPGYTWTTTALPAGLTLDGATITGTPTATGSTTVTATVKDSLGATATTEFVITVNAPAAPTAIADIQGSGAASPLVGQNATTEGVVTAVYPTGGFNGFYIQTPGEDTTPGRSDGLFVFTGANAALLTGIDAGDSVRVSGTVKEFGTLTELDVAAGTVAEVAGLGTVVPKTVIPGTDCALPVPGVAADCLSAAAIDTAREEVEGEAFAPTGDITVTDVYDGSAYTPSATPTGNNFGELGLAVNSDQALIAPTEIIDAQDTAAINARKAYNDAHRVILDDGSSTTYWNTANNAAGQNSPLPWLTADHQVRVGAAVSFDRPAVLDYRFGWKLQPAGQVVGKPTGLVTFEQNRPAKPADVGGSLKLATFNVLNYFTTLGESVTGCTSYKDRAGNPIAVNSCPGNGPRGAWNAANFERQQAKIIAAISTIDADIVSVEEIENSLVVDGAGTDRDEALSALVAALNKAAGSAVWDYVRSPASASDPANVGFQDVIRTGFIYRKAKVAVDGDAAMLFGDPAFDNAREPFAAVFKPVGGAAASRFGVIVNHFKSKGSGTNDGTGQGNANPDRVKQSQALAAFASSFSAARGVDALFLAGDFNAYSSEDPIQELEKAGYTQLGAEGKYSYAFDGQVGSLDHVLANAAAKKLVTGSDIWEINANETLYNQYSRYNYVGTDLYAANPFGASDHNPEVIGIEPAKPAPTTVQVLGTNDFHGRLLADNANAGGAAVLSGAVKQLRAENPNTVFAAAGDLIGASTFESFIANDEPTIDALNAAGLEVSAAGNHEFDKGYDDLLGRVNDRAAWEYIAANVKGPDGGKQLAPSWTKEVGGVKVGFVGAVTESLLSLVSPGGMQGVTVSDIVTATNKAAADLRAGGADVVVLLVHEGAANTDCASSQFTDASTTWGNIVQNTSPDVDAIISGHTHLAYNCSIPVKKWADDGRAVTKRPVVSAGQYGTNLNKLTFTVDPTDGDIESGTQEILSLTAGKFPADPAVQKIVDAAKANADEAGKKQLGTIAAPYNRAKLADGTTENRGGESTLGNLVAEVQRWATRTPEAGEAQIAFMNPGGLRADLAGDAASSGRSVTYKQAALVQPFANTLVNMRLTGAQIKKVLEQQWQRTSTGSVPSRPFLRLGVSKGFTYTYSEVPVTVNGTATFQGTVTGMWLDGKAVDPDQTYSVTVNQFLSTGGDNFFEFAKGAQTKDTGKIDLQAMVDYLAANAATTPLPLDAAQRAVKVQFPAGAPESYTAGDTVSFDVGSWAMTAPNDPKDTQLEVRLGDTVLGTATVDNTPGTATDDRYGTAAVSFALPADLTGGDVDLTLVGTTTGTRVTVPISVIAKAVPPVVNTAVPTITGTPRLGATLTARPGAWTPTPTKLAYQWLANGRPIAGATAPTLKLGRAQVGARISVQVTASAAGYTDAVAVSAATAPVRRGVATVISRVIPGGTVVAGRTQVSVAVRVTNVDGLPATGRVLVRIGSTTVAGTLRGNRVVVKIGRLNITGLRSVAIRYLGSDLLEPQRELTVVNVRRR